VRAAILSRPAVSIVQWLMLQQDEPDDYVIATGEQRSVRDFVDIAASEIGIAIKWEG